MMKLIASSSLNNGCKSIINSSNANYGDLRHCDGESESDIAELLQEH